MHRFVVVSSSEKPSTIHPNKMVVSKKAKCSSCGFTVMHINIPYMESYEVGDVVHEQTLLKMEPDTCGKYLIRKALL